MHSEPSCCLDETDLAGARALHAEAGLGHPAPTAAKLHANGGHPEEWPVSNEGLWNLERLWARGAKARRWIVEPLIEEADQVLLAGEPKCGKSFLASQLAMEIANGPGQLKISQPFSGKASGSEGDGDGQFRVAPRPDDLGGGNWRVLYVSFEMGPKAVWMRTATQAKELGVQLLEPNPAPLPPPDYEKGRHTAVLALDFLFELAPGIRTLGITPKRDGIVNGMAPTILSPILPNVWQALMERTKPDLIVFDSLVQLHFGEENSNPEMRDVLQAVRNLARVPDAATKGKYRYIAHIIIHHTRKENDFSPQGKSASSMRGASTIHSEADLAITITRRGKDTVSLRFSARHIRAPDDLPLIRSGMIYRGHRLPTKDTAASRILSIFGAGGAMSSEDFSAAFEAASVKNEWKESSKKKNSWEKILNRLVRDGKLSSVSGPRGKKIYSLSTAAPAPDGKPEEYDGPEDCDAIEEAEESADVVQPPFGFARRPFAQRAEGDDYPPF